MLDVNVVCEKQYQQHIDHVVGLQSCIEIVLMFIQHRSKDLNTCTTLVVSLVSNINTAFRNFGLHIYLEIMCLFKQFIYTQSELVKCVVNCSLPIRICTQICIRICICIRIFLIDIALRNFGVHKCLETTCTYSRESFIRSLS